MDTEHTGWWNFIKLAGSYDPPLTEKCKFCGNLGKYGHEPNCIVKLANDLMITEK